MNYYDPEAIYQDADIEQASYEREARHIEHLEAQGICVHGGWVGRSKTGEIYYPEQRDLVGDEVVCRSCGKKFPSDDAILAEREAILA